MAKVQPYLVSRHLAKVGGIFAPLTRSWKKKKKKNVRLLIKEKKGRIRSQYVNTHYENVREKLKKKHRKGKT